MGGGGVQQLKECVVGGGAVQQLEECVVGGGAVQQLEECVVGGGAVQQLEECVVGGGGVQQLEECVVAGGRFSEQLHQNINLTSKHATKTLQFSSHLKTFSYLCQQVFHKHTDSSYSNSTDKIYWSCCSRPQDVTVY